MISNLLLTSSAVVFPLITFPYLTNVLSSQNLGNVFFIDAFTQYFVIFSAIGIPFYGVREIAKLKGKNSEQSQLVLELVTLQLSLAVFFSISFIGLALLIPKIYSNISLVIISCITIISSSFLIEWYYQGIENYGYITKRSLIIKAISVLAIIFLVKKSDDQLIYYSVTALMIFLNAVLNFTKFILKHYKKDTMTFTIKKHIRPLMVLFSINVSVSVYTILDTIILGLLTDPVSVSYYNVPLKLVKIFWVVVSGAGVVLIPRISNLFINNQTSEIASIMTKSFSIVFLLTIPFCIFCFFFPTEILMLISGEKYINAINSLRLLSTVPLVIGCCNVLGTQYLMPIGKEKHILYATIVGLIVSLLLNFLLIPHYTFLGSSIACLASEMVVFLYILNSARKTIKIKLDFNLIFQILTCTVLTTSLGFYMPHKSLLFFFLILGFTYLVLFALTHYFFFKNAFIYSIIKFKKGN